MRRELVDSSVIASLGYDPGKRTMELQFRDGEIYDYLNVPPEEYAAFRNAESKGTCLNQVFKLRDYSVQAEKKVCLIKFTLN
jgi:hypothetical protein